MSLLLLILTSALIASIVFFKLRSRIELYNQIQHTLSCISLLRTSINTVVNGLQSLPTYYIEDLLLDNCQLLQDTKLLVSYVRKSNLRILINKSKCEKLYDTLVELRLEYISLETKVLRLSTEYTRLINWKPPSFNVPSGNSKLAWMYGECSWTFFKKSPTILSEIEYTTHQLNKYLERKDLDKAIILLYRLEELEKLRDLDIEKTNANRKEIEDLSKRYLTKVKLVSQLRSQLDGLDLTHLIETDPNTAGIINELYSLMNVGIHEKWTKDYYQGKYDWFDEMVKGEVLLDKAVSMYQDLERRCGEK